MKSSVYAVLFVVERQEGAQSMFYVGQARNAETAMEETTRQALGEHTGPLFPVAAFELGDIEALRNLMHQQQIDGQDTIG